MGSAAAGPWESALWKEAHRSLGVPQLSLFSEAKKNSSTFLYVAESQDMLCL